MNARSNAAHMRKRGFGDIVKENVNFVVFVARLALFVYELRFSGSRAPTSSSFSRDLPREHGRGGFDVARHDVPIRKPSKKNAALQWLCELDEIKIR